MGVPLGEQVKEYVSSDKRYQWKMQYDEAVSRK